MQTYDELLADSFQLVDTSEPNKSFSKQGRNFMSTEKLLLYSSGPFDAMNMIAQSYINA